MDLVEFSNLHLLPFHQSERKSAQSPKGTILQVEKSTASPLDHFLNSSSTTSLIGATSKEWFAVAKDCLREGLALVSLHLGRHIFVLVSSASRLPPGYFSLR